MTSSHELPQSPRTSDKKVLCVALEGSLLPSGLQEEASAWLLRGAPGALWKLPAWILRGRSALNDELGEKATLDVATLPFEDRLLDFLRSEHAKGRELVLVTSGPARLASEVAGHLGLFAGVVRPSQGKRLNRKTATGALTERYGADGFEYVMTSGPRVVLWSGEGERTLFPLVRPGFRTVLETMRVHQWAKNVLVFVPLFADQALDQMNLVVASVAAFFAFSLVASSGYVINDIIDLAADRRHERKRHRPFASGRLPLSWAPWLVLFPLLLGVLAALVAHSPPFLILLFGYLSLSLAYSMKLKGAVLIDVLVLSGLYTIRIIAGAAATGVELSMWLLAFSMFLFLSLAMVKRYNELFALISQGSEEEKIPVRSYRKGDLMTLVSMGTASGYISVLVLALYIVSDEAAQHYSETYLIWLLCPLLLYWISRAWIVVGRHEMHDDPLVWAVRDQISRWVGVLWILVVVLAR